MLQKYLLKYKHYPIAQWMWYTSGGILGLSLLVLVIGLITAWGESNAKTTDLAPDQGSANTPGNSDTSGKSDALDSPLLVAAKEFTDKWLKPPPPPPKTPPPKIENSENTGAEAAPPPPPPPPVVKVIPNPNFSVEATMVFDGQIGVAWIRKPGNPSPEQVWTGQRVDEYTIEEIGHGFLTVIREGKDFTLKVPEPQPNAAGMSAAPTPNPTPTHPTSSRPPRTRPSRPASRPPRR